MGVKLHVQKESNTEYVRSVHDMTRIVIERIVSPVQTHDFLYPFTRNYRIQKRALEHLHRQSSEVIKTRVKELEDVKNQGSTSKATKSKKAFLDLLLEARIDGRKLTQEEIRDEVDTFLFAVNDFTLVLL
jgi:cytochrome P450